MESRAKNSGSSISPVKRLWISVGALSVVTWALSFTVIPHLNREEASNWFNRQRRGRRMLYMALGAWGIASGWLSTFKRQRDKQGVDSEAGTTSSRGGFAVIQAGYAQFLSS